MPVLGPGGTLTFSLSDLDGDVILKCENRTTDLARADVWLRDALLEITSDPDLRDEFDQLEELGPPFNLTAKIQEYNEIGNYIPTGDVNTATLDILIWQDPPFNTLRRRLEPSHYQKADNFQPSFALPTEWYRFGSTIGFTPIPDQNYQTQCRILRMHPINDNTLSQTQILIPRDWNEILVWAAVERGFMELLEYEKASAVHQLLHGDPKYPAKLGLLNGRKKRRTMEAHRVTSALRPVVRPSCWGR